MSLRRTLFQPLPPRASAVVSLVAALVVAPAPVAALAYMADGAPRGLAAYGVCIALGMPAYVVLLWKRWLSWWHYLLAGLVASTIAALAWSASLFATSANTHSLEYLVLFVTGTVLVAWLPGALVALLAWPLVRQGSLVLAAAIWGENAT